MSEELLQRNLLKNPAKIGKWDFYSIGATSVKALKEYGIIRNVDYGEEERKKVDGLIVQEKNVIAVVEYKKPSEFKTKKQKEDAINQELSVAKKLNASLIIATDTFETVWVNVLTGNIVKNENGEDIKTNFDPNDQSMTLLIEKIVYSINELNDQIKPKELVNPTGLAKQIWQDVWAVSGATPENCLYTFVELFTFKYLSDLSVLREPENFDYLMKLYESRDPDYILEYYANNIRPKIKYDLFPQGKDGTTIINGTIFVSKDQKAVKGYSTVFKKVLIKFRDYGKLENIDHDFKSQLFESFLKESISKKNWGQFFTPLKVVKAIAEMAKDEIRDGIDICDPACGVGKFLLEPIKTKIGSFYEVKNGRLISKIKLHGYDKGFDNDEQKTIILAKANMLIYFSDLIRENPTITEQFSNLFNESFLLKTNSILGTLSEPINEKFDLILTNPPYVTSGSSNLKEEIKKDGELVNHYKINAIGVEGLFMEWIIRALKPGGKAFIVVPDGIFNRHNDKNLREFILDTCFIDGIISLPLNTFFTTNKKTYILCITKKKNPTEKQIEPVFTYLVSEIGESRDIYRFDIDQNDLSEAVTMYSFFKANKNEFGKISTDKRCKIQPIDKLIDSIEKDWLVDNWWTQEEKVELGIREKANTIDINEFSSLVEDLTNSIRNQKEEIEDLRTEERKKHRVTKYKISDLFEIVSGNSKITLNYINKNQGDYIVYSANTKENGVFGYINTYDFDVECIQITTNGVYAGTVFYRPQHKFSINADARLLIKKDDNLDYGYLVDEIKDKFSNYNFGWENKASIRKIKDIELEIPVDDSGNFDLNTQKEIAEKKRRVRQIKENILNELTKLSLFQVEF